METSDETQSLFPKVDRSKRRRNIIGFLVLLLAYILIQADQQALAVLIPSEIRCFSYSNTSCVIEKAVNTTVAAPTSLAPVWYHDIGAARKMVGSTTRTLREEEGSCDAGHCISFSALQQGIMTGPAYILLYCVVSLPLSGLTFARTKVFIVGLTVTLAMVIVTALSETHLALLMARIAVGVGAALCNPVHLIADYIHKAISFYTFGIYFGGAAGYALSAISGPLCWQWVFGTIAVALSASLLLSLLTLREPERVSVPVLFGRRYTLKETFHCLMSSRAFLVLTTGACIRSVGCFALTAWLPTLYSRRHRQEVNHFGPVLAGIVLLGGGLGSLIASHIADRYEEHRRPRKAYFMMATQLISIPFMVIALIADDIRLSYGLLSMGYLSAETWLGCTLALIQDMFPLHLSHQASLVCVLAYTLIGGCFGPLLVPAIMQSKKPWAHCDQGVGPALAIMVVVSYSLSSLFFGAVGCLMKDEGPPSDEVIPMSYETSDVEMDSSTEAEYQV